MDVDCCINLHQLASTATLEIANILISSGVDPHAVGGGALTALHWAAIQDDTMFLDWLLSIPGFDICLAASHGKRLAAFFLIERGADKSIPAFNGDTAVYAAMSARCDELARDIALWQVPVWSSVGGKIWRRGRGIRRLWEAVAIIGGRKRHA
jgi:ankyrin repeat protein